MPIQIYTQSDIEPDMIHDTSSLSDIHNTACHREHSVCRGGSLKDL